MGLFKHDARAIKFDVLVHAAEQAYNDTLNDEEMASFYKKLIPGTKAQYRCCVYKEREILRQRGRLALCKNANDEAEKSPRQIVQVIDAACDGCTIKKIQVTDNCRKCMMKACMASCHFDAIKMGEHRAMIDYDKCRECGLCAQNCPYHAIVVTERPCSAACPVNAISWNEDGITVIDENKCINCGRCLAACPFGAIEDKSWIVPVINDIRDGRKMIAMVAPSIQGQFDNYTLGQIREGIRLLGFADVVEVALGADAIAVEEYEELKEHMEAGVPLTTSCCPAFANMAKIHFPDQYKKNMSTTVSPMIARARMYKEKDPDCGIVFIGPCIAKKQEVIDSPVDYAITYEELGAMFVAKRIYLKELKDTSGEWEASKDGRNFAVGGGVSHAVNEVAKARGEKEARAYYADGALECKKQLTLMKVGRFNYDILEGMCCTGGCVNGPACMNDAMSTKRNMTKENAQHQVTIDEALNRIHYNDSKHDMHRD